MTDFKLLDAYVNIWKLPGFLILDTSDYFCNNHRHDKRDDRKNR